MMIVCLQNTTNSAKEAFPDHITDSKKRVLQKLIFFPHISPKLLFFRKYVGFNNESEALDPKNGIFGEASFGFKPTPWPSLASYTPKTMFWPVLVGFGPLFLAKNPPFWAWQAFAKSADLQD